MTFTIAAAEQRHDRSGHHADARPGRARPRPDVLGPGHGEVLGARPGSGRPGGQDRRRRRRGRPRGRRSAVSLNTGDTVTWNFAPRPRASRTTCGSIAPGGNPARAPDDRSSEIVSSRAARRSRRRSRRPARGRSLQIHSLLDAGRRLDAAWSAPPTVTPLRRASSLRRRLHRVPRQDGATQGDWVKATNTGGREPVRVAGHGLGRGPAHGRVPLDRQGRQRRGDQVGRVRHRHPRPGLPGDRGVRRSDHGRGAAAGPLLRLGLSTPTVATLSYKWEFADGIVLGRARHAHVHQAGHVHGEGDRDRRRGRQDLQGGHGHGDGAGRLPPTVEARPTAPAAPAPLSGAVHGDRRRPGRARRATSLYTWDFGDGGKLVRPEPDAHLQRAGHVHRQGDGHRRAAARRRPRR